MELEHAPFVDHTVFEGPLLRFYVSFAECSGMFKRSWLAEMWPALEVSGSSKHTFNRFGDQNAQL